MSATSATPSQASNTVTAIPEPLPYSGPEDIDNELQAVLAIYVEKEGEANWATREKALQRIRGLVASGAGTDRHFQTNLKQIVGAITESMLSLRTQLALQACMLVADLAKEMKDDFAPYAEPFSAVLLKLFAQTKKLLANAASDTMAALVSNVQVPKLLANYCATLNNKNKEVRFKGSEVVKQILAQWSVESLAEGEGSIETALRVGLVDATPAVRETSRTSFWRYALLFPARVPEFFKSINSDARKYLEKFRPKDLQLATDYFDFAHPVDPGSSLSLKAPSPLSQSNSGDLGDSGEMNEGKSPVEVAARKSPLGFNRERPKPFAFKDKQPGATKDSETELNSPKATTFFNLEDLDPAEDDFPQPTPAKSTPRDREIAPMSGKPSTSQKPLSIQTDTPKKHVREDKENILGSNSAQTTPQKDGFMTPSTVRSRELPKTPSTASPYYDWDKNLPLLLTQLEGGSPKEDLFRKLGRLSKTNADQVWRINFEIILRLCTEFLQRREPADPLQRERCLEFLKVMLVYQKDYFEGRTSDILHLLIKVERESDSAIKCAAQDALAILASNLLVEEVYTAVYDALAAESVSEEEQKLLFPLIPKCLGRLSFDKTGLLASALPSLAPFLINVFQHKNSHIRRSVVEAIIEIKLVTTEEIFLTHFGALNLQQRKLVDMCMKKTPASVARSPVGDGVEE